jgi:Kdo2-lipid IVA lauroyltransferase/acyltransferase
MSVVSTTHQFAPIKGGRRSWLQSLMVGIPQRSVVALGRALGQAAYYLDIPHRRVVRRNLEFCFPDWPLEQIRSFSQRIYQNLGIVVAEMFQMNSFSREDVLQRVEIRGKEHLEEALAQKRGVVLTSVHLANWEMAALMLGAASQTPVTVISKELRFSLANRWNYKVRGRLGVNTVHKKDSFPEMLQAIRQGHIVVITVDMNRGKNEVEVEFLGKRATTTLSAALLAMRCRSPIVPGFCYRNRDGRLVAEVKPAITVVRTGDLRVDLQRTSQQVSDAIEEAVRRFPDQWLWHQKRWKVFYPQLYPEYFSEWKRRKEEKMRRRRRTTETDSPN